MGSDKLAVEVLRFLTSGAKIFVFLLMHLLFRISYFKGRPPINAVFVKGK